jgi:hypothetical protein
MGFLLKIGALQQWRVNIYLKQVDNQYPSAVTVNTKALEDLNGRTQNYYDIYIYNKRQ